MSYTVEIKGYGYFDASGFGGSARDTIADAQSLDTLTWPDVSDDPFDRYEQLDAMSKCAMVAVEMAGIDSCIHADSRDGMGIAMGTQECSLGADIDLAAGINGEKRTSPRLFVYTLPSTVCGDIAIRHDLNGPNACFQAGEESGIMALREGFHLVASGEAEACVCVGSDALFPAALETAKQRLLLEGDGTPSAYALVLARGEEASPEDSSAAEEVASLIELRDFLARDAQEDFVSATLDDQNGALMYMRRSGVLSS